MKSTITQDDWTAAVAEIGASTAPLDPAAKTTQELTVLWGCSRTAVQYRLRKLMELGRVEICRKFVPRQVNSGVSHPYPAVAYKLLKAKKK